MKIIQDDAVFQPIYIMLETKEEAEALWAIMEEYVASRVGSDKASPTRQLAMNISNDFSTNRVI